MTQETPGAILSRGPKGFEAVGEDNESHGFFNSQKEAAAALQQMAHALATRRASCNLNAIVPWGR